MNSRENRTPDRRREPITDTQLLELVRADVTILATGGIGGLYRHSTNFRHLTGDGLAIALKHDITLQDINYVQIHPTTFNSDREEDRSFLISESVRGEGAKLYDKHMQRFVDELIPRDLLTAAIREQMEKDGTPHVWEDMRPIEPEEQKLHFPNIVAHAAEQGYDTTKECIPVVPAQHYFMGGIKVNHESATSMDRLYAVGETACNGVHGRNRLASNSLLESMVFARRAAQDITKRYEDGKLSWESIGSDKVQDCFAQVDLSIYQDDDAITEEYRRIVREAIKQADENDSDFKDEEDYRRIQESKKKKQN